MDSGNSSRYRSPKAPIPRAAGYPPVRFRHDPLSEQGTVTGGWRAARPDRHDIRPEWSAASARRAAPENRRSHATPMFDLIAADDGWPAVEHLRAPSDPLRPAVRADPTNTRWDSPSAAPLPMKPETHRARAACLRTCRS